jgi:transposase-like protein
MESNVLAIRDWMRVVADQPLCPSCGNGLRFTRVTPRSGGRTGLQTFGCQECGVWLTEAANEPIPHGGEHY